MAHPLRKVTLGAAIFMVVLLTSLLTLGFRQYQLLSRHDQVINQSEKLLFQFATIREQITAILLEQRYRQLAGVVSEVEELHVKVNQIVKNANIPDEYKLSFINQVDLPGLILLLYKGADPEQSSKVTPLLNQETRKIGNRLMLFDRLLVNHAKRKVINFQSLVIGILALSVFLIVNILLLGHRRLATPLIELADQVRQVHDGERANLAIHSPGRANEVNELADAFQNLLSTRQQFNDEQGRRDRVLFAIHRAGIACRQALTRVTLFQSVSRALLFNEDYSLIWIGAPENNSGSINPVTVAGSPTMSEDECEKCLAVFLEAGDEQGVQNNPAIRALATGKPVVATNLLADIPPAMLKGTVLSSADYTACAAFPLQWRRKTYGVLTIYVLNRESLSDNEIELLTALAGAMGLALHIFAEEQQLHHEQERTKVLLAALDAPLLTISRNGEIQTANRTFSELAAIPDEQIIGRHWLTILQPASQDQPDGIDKEELLTALAARNEEVELHIRSDEKRERVRGKFTPIHDEHGVVQEFAFIGKACAINSRADSEINQQCQTVISELSAGVAHEISDLSNGIINFAQLLADNNPAQADNNEDKKILDKIINGGERIAEIVHKLIFYGQREHVEGEYLPLPTVLDDAVMLIKHHLQTEGIQLALELNARPQSVPVHARIMQQALINIFNHRRHALNRKYGGRDADKRLTVGSDSFIESGKRYFRINFTDHGEDLTAADVKRFDSINDDRSEITNSLKELHHCRRLVESQGGSLTLEKQPGIEALSVRIVFPHKG